LQERMHDLARPLALVLLAVIGAVSLWTPLAHGEIAERWFSLPNLFWFLPVPLLVLLTFWQLLRSVANYDNAKPFVLTPVLIFLGYAGLGLPTLFGFLPVPRLVLLTFWQLLRSVANYDNAKPFVLTLVLIFLGYAGLGISLWPNIVPPHVTFWDAAAPPQSQGFALVGALLIIPFILGYTAWSYYVFRGKVTHDDPGYH